MSIRKHPTGQDGKATTIGMPSESEVLRKLKIYCCMKVVATKGLWKKYTTTMQESDYTRERSYLREIIMNDSVLPEACFVGLAIALSTFVLFSRIPRIGMALGQHSPRTHNGSWYTLDIPPGEETSFKFFSMITNVLLFLPVSVIMGGLAVRDIVDHYADHEVIAEKISKIPLLPGRSLVSDEFCSTLIEATLQIRDCQLKPFKSNELRHYMTFAHNCQARRIYEQIMRKELGTLTSLPVVVSPSGVPILEESEFDLWSEQAVLDHEEASKS
jgi:hypothetical protein